MKTKLLISLMLLAAGPVLTAQKMTLNDCLVYARDHAHRNILNTKEVDKAGADITLAVSDFLPGISASTSGNISFGRNIDPETNGYDNKRTLSTAFGLQMSIPVFDGLVNVNNLKAARVARLRKVQTAQVDRDMISLEVIKAFYNVSYCKAMVDQMQQQLERDSTDLRATERCEQLGTKSGADVAEMRALVASDRYELSTQRGLLAKAFLNLRGKMGMELTDEPLDLVENEEMPCQPSTATAPNPRIAEAELALKESRHNLLAAKGSYWPRISLNAGISTSYYRMMGSDERAPGFRSQWHNNMGQYVGFSVSIPLFSGLSTTARVHRARIEVEQSRTQLEQTRYEVERETTEAAIDLKTATDEHIAATRRLEAEQLAYNAMRRKYELGSASSIDLYTSGAKLAAARAGMEGSRIRKIISRITLGYYHGESLIKE